MERHHESLGLQISDICKSAHDRGHEAFHNGESIDNNVYTGRDLPQQEKGWLCGFVDAKNGLGQFE